ncbi:hypothetical protein C8Q79DRAFT_935263 [Trametes meyenii]|nr:hypothetical protein C8Q79DRAFT_935263 [Trametes meyenii]
MRRQILPLLCGYIPELGMYHTALLLVSLYRYWSCLLCFACISTVLPTSHALYFRIMRQ